MGRLITHERLQKLEREVDELKRQMKENTAYVIPHPWKEYSYYSYWKREKRVPLNEMLRLLMKHLGLEVYHEEVDETRFREVEEETKDG